MLLVSVHSSKCQGIGPAQVSHLFLLLALLMQEDADRGHETWWSGFQPWLVADFSEEIRQAPWRHGEVEIAEAGSNNCGFLPCTYRFQHKTTSTEWWDCIIRDTWDDQQWHQNFRSISWERVEIQMNINRMLN